MRVIEARHATAMARLNARTARARIVAKKEATAVRDTVAMAMKPMKVMKFVPKMKAMKAMKGTAANAMANATTTNAMKAMRGTA